MYVCPHCKGALVAFACSKCGARYSLTNGIPSFVSGRSGDQGQFVPAIYDDIYSHHENVWADQGRSRDFIAFFCDLVSSVPHENLLEVGCGEGVLLAALPGTNKFGIDPSIHALERAAKRSVAKHAVALSEELPFPDGAFDVVVSVGVMEHFADPDAATKEIHRVLRGGGHYLALIHTDMSGAQRFTLKIREFLFPKFRPLAFASWVRKKLWHPIRQPLRKSYTIDSAQQRLQRSGLGILRVITRGTEPDAPLAGDHVVILVTQKPALVGQQ